MKTEWEVEEKMPRYDDMRLFEVWLDDGQVRTVRRIGNRSRYFTPGALVFTDCAHPLENALCDEERVVGWRYCGAPVTDDMEIRLDRPHGLLALLEGAQSQGLRISAARL